jgi:hypothetical protein
MIQTQRNSLSILILVCSLITYYSCSGKPKQPTPTAFMGHTIGESSMGWSAEENTGDPLSRCQEVLRLSVLKGLEELAQKCQDFVENGNYLIIVRDTHELERKRAYRFADWKLALIVEQLPYGEKDNLIMELNSHFAVVEPKKRWLGKDGAAIEIRPNEEFRLFTGETARFDGFLVVVSSTNVR